MSGPGSGQIFSDYSKKAAENPEHAWFPEVRSAEEVSTPTPANRMVGFPYTKYMCAFNEIDMGAAVLLTSLGKARELGVAEDKLCFIHATASTEEDTSLLSRPNYFTSTQHEQGFKALLAAAGKTVADISGWDIYSPFPINPQIAAKALNVPVDQPAGWTLTGGHSSHGAPGAGYGVHSVAATVEACRSNRGGFYVNNTNGGQITTQGYGCYSTAPYPKSKFAMPHPQTYQALIDAVPRPRFSARPEGSCTIETYTVSHGHFLAAPVKGPNRASG